VSDTIASFTSTVAPAIQAVAQVFGGAGTVTLGSVVFSGYEVPEQIPWGGSQGVVKQIRPGGVVDMALMGVVFPPITWTGFFNGAAARSRARQVYAMLNAGAPVSLSWGDRLYTVIVANFTSRERYSNWIPYSVTCDVVRDETLAGGSQPPTLLAQVSQDITSALGLTPDTLASVQTAIGQAQTLATAGGVITGGSSAALALQGGLSAAQGAVGGAQSIAEGNIGGIVGIAEAAGSVFPPGNAATGASNLNAAASAAGTLAALLPVAGYLGRCATNVGNAA
jgi:hypothetical protein